jgi:hypothetical protein
MWKPARRRTPAEELDRLLSLKKRKRTGVATTV